MLLDNPVVLQHCEVRYTLRRQVRAHSYGPLRPNVTSSIKPEVHYVAQRHQRRTQPQPQGISRKNFVPISAAVPEICSQTDRQTDRLIMILCTPTEAVTTRTVSMFTAVNRDTVAQCRQSNYHIALPSC